MIDANYLQAKRRKMQKAVNIKNAIAEYGHVFQNRLNDHEKMTDLSVVK